MKRLEAQTQSVERRVDEDAVATLPVRRVQARIARRGHGTTGNKQSSKEAGRGRNELVVGCVPVVVPPQAVDVVEDPLADGRRTGRIGHASAAGAQAQARVPQRRETVWPKNWFQFFHFYQKPKHSIVFTCSEPTVCLDASSDRPCDRRCNQCNAMGLYRRRTKPTTYLKRRVAGVASLSEKSSAGGE